MVAAPDASWGRSAKQGRRSGNGQVGQCPPDLQSARAPPRVDEVLDLPGGPRTARHLYPDISREDLVALDPSESTIIYRGFRDFVGPYVAHCHNLAHEDHAMMFGWTIVP